MLAAMRVLISLVAVAFHVLRWFVHEFLLLRIHSAVGSGLTNLCRIAGCLVIVLSLRVELRDGLLPSTTAALMQVGIAGFTAVLFGNIAKELAFDLCARFIVWSGRVFLRTGLTVAGNMFWEMQFRDGTWIRGETATTGTCCEWIGPDGRASRV